MVKDLTTTMLAAVAAVAGAFVLAWFRSPFDARVFAIGLAVYAGYVLLFPLAFGMPERRQRFDALLARFDTRRTRLAALLTPDRVAGIVGDQVAVPVRRFRTWFALTAATFPLLALAMLLVAAQAWHHPDARRTDPPPSVPASESAMPSPLVEGASRD